MHHSRRQTEELPREARPCLDLASILQGTSCPPTPEVYRPHSPVPREGDLQKWFVLYVRLQRSLSASASWPSPTPRAPTIDSVSSGDRTSSPHRPRLACVGWPSAPAKPSTAPVSGDMLHHWNRVAIDTSGLDHTPVAAGESRVFGEQLGPGRSSRAMAIVHIAIYDAINSITHRDIGFSGIPDVAEDASIDAAVARAAHDTLVVLFPSQKAHCDQVLAEDLARIPEGAAKDTGPTDRGACRRSYPEDEGQRWFELYRAYARGRLLHRH